MTTVNVTLSADNHITFTIRGQRGSGITIRTAVVYDSTQASITRALQQARTRLLDMTAEARTNAGITTDDIRYFTRTYTPPSTITARARGGGARPAAGASREEPAPRVSMGYLTFLTARLQRASGDNNRTADEAVRDLDQRREGLNEWMGTGANRWQTVRTVFNILYQDPEFREYFAQQAAADADIHGLGRRYRLQPNDPEGELPGSAVSDRNGMEHAELVISRFIQYQRGRPDQRRFATDFTIETHPYGVRVPTEMNAELLIMTALYARRASEEHHTRAVWRRSERVASPESGAISQQPRTALLFGDSITNQFQLNSGGSGAIRELRPNVNPWVYAHDGRAIYGPDGMLGHIDVALGQRRYDDIFICAGANDLLVRNGPRETREQRIRQNSDRVIAGLERLYRATRERHVRVIAVTIPPILGYENIGAEENEARLQINEWIREQHRLGHVGGLVDLEPTFADPQNGRLRREFWRSENDCAHHSRAGIAELGRQYALQGYPITAARPVVRQQPQVNPLEQFAREHWANLSRQLVQAATDGRPRDLLALTRTLPEGYTTLEAALTELRREGEPLRAFESFFNTVLHSFNNPLGNAFLTFCSSGLSYEYYSLPRPGITLNERSPAQDRQVVLNAVMDFLRQERPEDLRYLESLGVQNEYMRAMLGLAIYQWRTTHQNAAPDAWMNEAQSQRDTRPALRMA